MPYSEFDPDQLILRDYLAIDRTLLANQRTFLAYVRTTVLLAVSGVTLIKLFLHITFLLGLGYCLLVVSGVTLVVGAINYLWMKKKIRSAIERPASSARRSSDTSDKDT